MSRYKKVVTGEVELDEIEGIKFLIYPTMETRLDLLELIKEAQTVDDVEEKDEYGKVISVRKARGIRFKVKDMAVVCAKIVFEGCWEHDINGKRLRKKEEEKETNYEDILNIVSSIPVFTLFSKITMELGLIDQEKIDEFKKKEEDILKKKDEVGSLQEAPAEKVTQ